MKRPAHSPRSLPRLTLAAALLVPIALPLSAAEIGTAAPKAADRVPYPVVAPASSEGLDNIRQFKIPEGFQVNLVAAEPMFANPVAFCIDWQGRFLVSETYRYRSSVLDIRHYMFMLEDDLALRTVEDRVAMIHKHFGRDAGQLAIESEVVRLVEDSNGDGQADKSTIFADGFNTLLDGIASGILARDGKVYFTNIPHLWELEDRDGDGRAEHRESLSYGYGVRFSYTGHDMHGLAVGPDGRLYFTFGDRGASVRTKEGGVLAYPDEGAVFRCNLDGTGMEMVHHGLRNPQELAFDDHGNLFTGDNDCDNGDHERWVYIVEGGDSGWRVGYQHAPLGKAGQWMSEKLWVPRFQGQAAYIIPPIANLPDGPSGLTYNPGTGFPEKYRGHFFLTHFKGSAANSGISTFRAEADGAGFRYYDDEQFLWHCLPTDVDFGYDGSMYFTDWHHDWPKSDRGRIYRVTHPEAVRDPRVAEVTRLFAQGFRHRPVHELVRLLGHDDKRVRQEAQFALVAQGEGAREALVQVANRQGKLLPRLHATWGLGQIARHDDQVHAPLRVLLRDADPEVRAQAARVLGDARVQTAEEALLNRLTDSNSRVQFFAAQALGRIPSRRASVPLLDLLRRNADKDLFLRHAATVALAAIGDGPALEKASRDADPAVRMGVLLAWRRLAEPAIARFLNDPQPALVLEAARAINDVPIPGALPQLAQLGTTKALLKMPQETPSLPDFQTPLALRVVNAGYRAGEAPQARILADLAASTNAPKIARVEALLALGRWAAPPDRDRIMGVYRPLAPRDPAPARQALADKIPALLQGDVAPVQVAAIESAGSLDLLAAIPSLAAVLQREDEPGEVRAAALAALDVLQAPDLLETVRQSVTDGDSKVRQEAIRLLARLDKDPTKTISRVLDAGSLREKQGALRALGELKTPASAHVLETWLDRLLAGQLQPSLQLDLLEAAERHRNRKVQARLKQFQDARPDTPLGRFAETLHGGDADAGRRIFYERPDANCLRCHKIQGEGGDVGPPQDEVGKRLTREEILQSIIDPSASIAEGYETLNLGLKDGGYLSGILKQENEKEITLLSPEDGLLTVKQKDVTTRTKGLSGMPSGLEAILSKQDLRNLVEFLAGLRPKE